ncbi:MAG: hypothetical protein INR62_08410 [Rhodospirillales bacterium]|nr:hypothetical protein [Acetobacter sp.]
MGTRSSEGALRAATATLLGNGGFAVQLRMPGSAVSGSDSEELGLGTPQPFFHTAPGNTEQV